jgi:hypothetical protein
MGVINQIADSPINNQVSQCVWVELLISREAHFQIIH